jgi:hypothetical protein
MRTLVCIKTQFEAIHCWPDCPIEEVKFLRTPHRHIFHVKMKWLVSHANREIEFIEMKRKVNKFLRETWDGADMGKTSCESFAISLLSLFNADFVSVYEDDENGAEVVKTSK